MPPAPIDGVLDFLHRAAALQQAASAADGELMERYVARGDEATFEALVRRHGPMGYKPQFFFRTTNVTGEVLLPDGTEMVMPGDNAAVAVRLDKPAALEIGGHFAIREGGKTVGSGVITELVE